MTACPLISVVVPVYAVRPYLTACLDSVLAAADEVPGGVEVVAVDDASPDGSGALLTERARADRRLSVIRLDRTAGPGNARNVGLASAAGEYVWFVDGDDLIPDGALPAVAAKLAADSPDMLLIDYAELHQDGTTRPSHGIALLGRAPAGTFSIAEAPYLVNLTMTAWSRLLRRDFLRGLGEPFRPGIHEDIPVTCAALFAGRLSALARACYCYRRFREGSAMMSSAGQDAVFDAYREVLAMLGRLAAAGDPVATPAVRSAVFERAIWHYAAVFQTAGLVPRRDRRAFFGRMHEDFVRYEPPGYVLPPGPRGAKLALIRRGAYRTYELLEPLNRSRVALRQRTHSGDLRQSGVQDDNRSVT